MMEKIQTTIEALRELANENRSEGKIITATDALLIADYIESAIHSQWVQVEHKLPEHWSRVFVCMRGKTIMAHYCRIRCMFLSVDTGDMLDGITHWHAIDYPEPPQAQP